MCRIIAIALLALPWGLPSARAQQVVEAPSAAGLQRLDRYTLAGERSLLSDYPALAGDGLVNVVVEIPAGTNAKWEVSKEDGRLKWEIEEGRPRVVQYLGYPGNYGMVPCTKLSKELGGDGDPLDVLILGPAVPRGAVVPARLIGVLKMLDRGEQDDKLLAVRPGTPFADVRDMPELRRRFPGVTAIVETWFANYKGPGKIKTAGYGSRQEAEQVLEAAIRQYGQ